MKIKLAALLAFVILGLAGCDGAGGNANNSNATRNGNSATTTNTTSSTTTTKDDSMVKANATPTDKTGGTTEGCKCSAGGMECDGKDSCCGKTGCSTMKDGKSECCSKDGSGEMSCCSTAGKSAGTEGGPEKKPETAPAKKS